MRTHLGHADTNKPNLRVRWRSFVDSVGTGLQDSSTSGKCLDLVTSSSQARYDLLRSTLPFRPQACGVSSGKAWRTFWGPWEAILAPWRPQTPVMLGKGADFRCFKGESRLLSHQQSSWQLWPAPLRTQDWCWGGGPSSPRRSGTTIAACFLRREEPCQPLTFECWPRYPSSLPLWPSQPPTTVAKVP